MPGTYKCSSTDKLSFVCKKDIHSNILHIVGCLQFYCLLGVSKLTLTIACQGISPFLADLPPEMGSDLPEVRKI